MSKRQTKEQERAAQALKDIQRIEKEKNESLNKKYHSLARKMPAMVQSNGLGQALAFLRAKAGRDMSGEHGALYKHVSQWVMQELDQGKKKDSLLEWIVTQETAVYRRATVETMAYLSWIKRFAEAILPEPTGNEE